MDEQRPATPASLFPSRDAWGGHPCALTLLIPAQEPALAPIHLTQFWGGPCHHPPGGGSCRAEVWTGDFPPSGPHPAILRLRHVVPHLWAHSPRPPPALGPSGGFLNLITERERQESPGLCRQPRFCRTLLIFQKKSPPPPPLRVLRTVLPPPGRLVFNPRGPRIFRPAGAGRWG